ncbi:predicted protein [Lichtheimia corymbifera JMRC:FSU:9682]|uniref:Uncharacterized protein n=1 Tax=Lichtheimia corymbifera JMRC:FSU:9682 TaxID=1263082 RepID=A0A068RZC0_9FUNG|nr:predicted protein [Lichtheimia corymbifera JMRC:FSU:9682]
MPFLRNFLNRIKHDSALQMFDVRQTVPMPLEGFSEWIKQSMEREGVQTDNAVNLFGPSGGGKTWTLTMLVEDTLQHTDGSILCLDLDGRWNTTPTLGHERFHLYQPSTAMQVASMFESLDDWFDQHADEMVLWVLVDGITILDGSMLSNLRQCQRKWKFALATTCVNHAHHSSNLPYDYYFYISKESSSHHPQVKMTWPIVSKPFSLINNNDHQHNTSAIRPSYLHLPFIMNMDVAGGDRGFYCH